jgi:hypothetical protein
MSNPFSESKITSSCLQTVLLFDEIMQCDSLVKSSLLTAGESESPIVEIMKEIYLDSSLEL